VALVGDVEQDLVVDAADLDTDPAGGRVADGVGQRLLADPVQRPGAACRQLDAVYAQVDLTPGCPDPPGQLLEVGDRGLDRHQRLA
jgi:hypothetical protein